MRKILVPTDFSDNAMNAIEYALELFKHEKSHFYLMHAYQDKIYANTPLLNQETLHKTTQVVSSKSKQQLESTLKHIKEVSHNSKHTYSIISSNSMLIDEADKVVDDEDIDIIVMGTHGETYNRSLTFGSHTLQVLRYVQCPVLAIPANYKYAQPTHMLFPTDYMIPYKQRELKLLCEIALPYKAVIDMLYISKSDKLSLRQQNNQTFIKDSLHKNSLNFKTIKEKNIASAIYAYLKDHKIDMLVMVNTRHSFLESILFQSTVDKMSLHIDIPFLALQNIRRIQTF